MAASSNPDPEEHDALTSWERRALADIEGDLAASDPRLARKMAGTPRRMPRWWPMSLRATLLLVVMQFVLIGAATLVPLSLPAVLSVITVLVVVPWVVLCAVENDRKS